MFQITELNSRNTRFWKKDKYDYDKKINRNKMDRSCFGNYWNPSDGFWNLQR